LSALKPPRVPTLQHFSTLVGADVAHTVIKLERLQRSAPLVNYDPTRKIGHDALVLGLSSQTAIQACERIKREKQRVANLDALDAFLAYREDLPHRRHLETERRYFSIARGIRVPVNPPLVAIQDGRVVVLWFSFWRSRQLNDVQKAIFATILDRVVFGTPDFAGSELEFVDLSAPHASEPRSVKLLSRRDFDVLSDAELRGHTDNFAEAFLIVRDRASEAARADQPSRPSAAAAPLLIHLDDPR
jgi:hypothetical protein